MNNKQIPLAAQDKVLLLKRKLLSFSHFANVMWPFVTAVVSAISELCSDKRNFNFKWVPCIALVHSHRVT